ncbi:MAG: B12-binding domain-containing protein, partial [Candidatus Promineifilaceae bacterium]
MSREEEILDGLYANTLEGVNEVVVDLTHEGIALGMEPTVLLNEALIPAVREAGRLFECDEYFVPEMLVAGEAMAAAVEVIRPLIVNGGREPLA